MYNNYSSPTVTNCTFSSNSASGGGEGSPVGGMYNIHGSSPKVTNCILWGDTPNEIINQDDGCSPIVTYCDVQDEYDGEGNINELPLFVNADARDFHLQALSPCIDKGNDTAVLDLGITTDLDGNPRIMDGDGNGTATVDIGAYELQTSDLANDWSSTTNPNGAWSYGWEASPGQAFNLYDVCDTSIFEGSPIWYSSSLGGHPPEVWKNTGSGSYNYVQPGEVSLHPGSPDSGGQFSVVRWTSPLAGNVSINGYFGAGDIGMMSYFIYKNSTTPPIFELDNTYADGNFTLTDNISPGDTLDFMIGEGYGYGSTPLHATITVTP